MQWTSKRFGHVHRRGQAGGLGEAVVVVQHRARSNRCRAPMMRMADGSIFSPSPNLPGTLGAGKTQHLQENKKHFANWSFSFILCAKEL